MMLSLILLFATDVTEAAVGRYSPTASTERVQNLQGVEQTRNTIKLVEGIQRNSKPFKIEFGNIYSIAWNQDDICSTHIAEAIEVVLDSAENLQTKAEGLRLQQEHFVKMLLLGLIQLANEGYIESAKVLLRYVTNPSNKYIANARESCAHLTDLETYLSNQKRGLVHVDTPVSEAHKVVRCHLGDIYRQIYREAFCQNLPSELERFATDDMAFVELFQSKKVTLKMEQKMRRMREEGIPPWKISQEVGFSMTTVLKHTNPKPRKDTWTGCFSIIFGSSADQADREPLLADQKKDQ